ncbi:putative metallopeptidase [Variovorax ginsengisoli]|uniref:Metallopeptidase n=1 Tax=Variovorax ginsengisoli TaxID=363844 RepID=A0ABT8S3L5_9BURK|nr:putative metallopeptidase [Variovorax ginsengisoli]MDN8612781.1 putative metallopeptidase [Variovorax ginsengisoli]MDO1531951.1 putative metallopeptidase [Variovorax ginsengisoli]
MPPADLQQFKPAPEVLEWIGREILAEDGRIHNPDHAHLIDADLEVLWAPGGFQKQMRTVIGQAEEVTFRAGGWQKMRQEEQFLAWFDRLPTFLITLDAHYAAQCSDVDWCALVEHELYHLAHKKDEFGAPVFTKDGLPKIGIRGHDVEEFVGVVRRYGVGDPNGAIAQLARAAGSRPEVRLADVAGACGTCLLRAA